MTKAQLETLTYMREAIVSQNSATEEATVDLAYRLLRAHAERPHESFFGFEFAPQHSDIAEQFKAIQRAYALLVEDGWMTPDRNLNQTIVGGGSSAGFRLTDQAARPLFGAAG